MRDLVTLLAALLLAAGSAPAADAATADAPAAAKARPSKPYKVPRTKDGQPDLQGIWTNSALTFLQRPPIFKNLIGTEKEEAMLLAGFKQLAGETFFTDHVDPRLGAPPEVKEAPQADFLEMDLHLARVNGQMRTSWIIEPADGRIPFTDAGKKAAREGSAAHGYDGPEARANEERCLTAIGSPEGPPMMNTGFNAHYQIVQTRDRIAILVEMNHDVRIIRMAAKGEPAPAHLPRPIQPWMGDSVGWWEGDTLVVETTNLNPKSYVGSLGGGFTWSPAGKLTERFTRTARDQLMYRFEVEDPAFFKQVWKAEMPMRTAPGPIYEYACHEGNYSLPNILQGARYQEKTTVAAK